MNIVDFLALRTQKFGEHLRSKGVDLPDRFLLRNLVRPLGANTLALDADVADNKPLIDEREMSATFCITTARQDRYGDVVLPKGCLKHIENYRRNPRVFFSHKSTELPIGDARKGKDGPLALEIQDNCIKSTCYFHGMTAESELVFKLVKMGCLEASSIGFLPVIAALIKDIDDEDLDDRNGLGEDLIYFGSNKAKIFPSLRFHEWDLTEWSIVPTPANPDAIAMHLSRGHVEGQVLTPSLRKSLEPFAAPLPIWSPGVLFEKMVEPVVEKDTNLLVDSVEAAVPEKVVETEVEKFADVPEKNPTPEPDLGQKPGVDPYENWSHGAKFLDSTSKLFEGVHKFMGDECGLLDQPKIKRYATKQMDRLQKSIYNLKKLGAKLYPDKFEDPGESPVREKSLDEVETKKEVPVVEEKTVAAPAPTSVEVINWDLILKEIATLQLNQSKISEKFYEITGIES